MKRHNSMETWHYILFLSVMVILTIVNATTPQRLSRTVRKLREEQRKQEEDFWQDLHDWFEERKEKK